MNFQNNNTIIFTISRMNPPTPGHLLLIRKLIEEAMRKNVPKVYVILSKTNDNNENPIDCQEKINVLGENVDSMNNMVIGLKNIMKKDLERQELTPSQLKNVENKIDIIEVIFLCVKPEQPSPIFPLYDIVGMYSNEAQNLNLFMIVGDDRADFLDTIVDSFLFKMPNVASVNGQILEREDMAAFKNLSPEQLSTISIEEMPVSAFSASFVRKLVKLGMKDKFDDVYRPYLRQEQINHLYEIISEGLNKPEPKVKSTKPKPPKYIYPIIRGDEQYNQKMEEINLKALKKTEKTKKGGKKKKRKTYRKTRISKKIRKARKY